MCTIPASSMVGPAAGPMDILEGDDFEAAVRWKVNQEARTILEKVFLQEPLPSKETLNRLAFELSVTARRVQVWFQNRRQRCARKWVNKCPPWSRRGMHELSALLPHPLGAAGMVKAEGSGESSLGVGGALFAQAGGGLEMGQSAAASPRAAALQLHGQLHTSARGAPESSAQSPYQMLLEAVPPHRIMWASLGWLELSGYLLQGVLGNTLAMFAGDATDPRIVAQLVQTMEEQGSEAAATVVHYTKRGRPFQHVLRVEPLRDAGLADIQFVLVTSVLLNPMSAEPPVAKAEAMLPGFVQLGVMQLADALRLGGYGEAGAALAHGVGQANARGAAMPSQGSTAADGMSEQQRQQLMRAMHESRMLQQLQQLSQWQQLAAQQLQLQLAQQQLHASSTQLQESASQQQLAVVMVASTQEPQPQARAAQQPAAQPCPPPAAAVAVTRDANPMAVDPVKQEARAELTEQQQLMLNLSSTLQPQPAHKHARWSSSVAPTQVEATIAAMARTPATVLAPPYEAGMCTAGTDIGTTDESGAWNEIDDTSVWSWLNNDDLAFERPASTR